MVVAVVVAVVLTTEPCGIEVWQPFSSSQKVVDIATLVLPFSEPVKEVKLLSLVDVTTSLEGISTGFDRELGKWVTVEFT